MKYAVYVLAIWIFIMMPSLWALYAAPADSIAEPEKPVIRLDLPPLPDMPFQEIIQDCADFEHYAKFIEAYQFRIAQTIGHHFVIYRNDAGYVLWMTRSLNKGGERINPKHYTYCITHMGDPNHKDQ